VSTDEIPEVDYLYNWWKWIPDLMIIKTDVVAKPEMHSWSTEIPCY